MFQVSYVIICSDLQLVYVCVCVCLSVNDCDWIQSACQLRRVDCGGLNIMNVKLMQTGSNMYED